MEVATEDVVVEAPLVMYVERSHNLLVYVVVATVVLGLAYILLQWQMTV